MDILKQTIIKIQQLKNEKSSTTINVIHRYFIRSG